MDKKFVAVLVIIAAVVGGIIFLGKDDTTTTTNTNVNPTNHVQGAGKKGVTLIEYGDFQCSACLQYYPVLKQVKEKYGDDITFQYRHFPLTSLHPNAFAAHRAAEAAAMQGKFWEMHDMLFEQQPAWENASQNAAVATFETYAEQLGLDMEKYREDARSSAVNDIIRADMREGEKLGIKSTPTFVLNGRVLDQGIRGLEGFTELIDAELAKQPKE